MGSGQDNDCHNIDECKLKIDNCGEKGDKGTYCQDNDGSFDCFCLPGFHMAESGRCENTNECLEGLVYRLISYLISKKIKKFEIFINSPCFDVLVT